MSASTQADTSTNSPFPVRAWTVSPEDDGDVATAPALRTDRAHRQRKHTAAVPQHVPDAPRRRHSVPGLHRLQRGARQVSHPGGGATVRPRDSRAGRWGRGLTSPGKRMRRKMQTSGGRRVERQFMAEKSATVQNYISSLPGDIQIILQEVRRTIRDAAPGADEKISWQMPTITLNGQNVVHHAAGKDHLGLYPQAMKPSSVRSRPAGQPGAL